MRIICMASDERVHTAINERLRRERRVLLNNSTKLLFELSLNKTTRTMSTQLYYVSMYVCTYHLRMMMMVSYLDIHTRTYLGSIVINLFFQQWGR